MSELNFHAVTHKGDKQEYNEDFVEGFQHEGVLFLLVGDGQGSDKYGQSASHVAINEIRRYMERHFKRGMEAQLETLFRDAFYLAHRVIEGVRKGDVDRYNGFCASVTAVAITPQKRITFAHVGSTKLFLLRDGNFIQMTKDHTVAQELLNQRKITPQDFERHPERGILTKALGIFPEVQVDVFSGAVAREDIIALVSDGITNHLQKEEMKQLILASGNIKTACEYLINGSNERGGLDNLSVATSYISF